MTFDHEPLHNKLMQESGMYRTAHELKLPGLMTALQLKELECSQRRSTKPPQVDDGGSKMNEDWFDIAQDTVHLLRNSHHDLTTVARTLSFFCEDSPAIRILRTVSESLKEQAEKLRRAISSKMDEDFRRAEESSTNMINACLAVVKEKS